MNLSDIIQLIMLLIAIVSICATIAKSGESVKVELANIRGELRDYVTHAQCHDKREECPCVIQMQELQRQAMKNIGGGNHGHD